MFYVSREHCPGAHTRTAFAGFCVDRVHVYKPSVMYLYVLYIIIIIIKKKQTKKIYNCERYL